VVKKNIDWLGVGALVVAMMVWATSFVALKSAIGPLGPMSVIFFRMFFASLCFIYFIKQFTKLSFTKDDLKYIAIMTLFEPCMYFIFEAKALQNTSAAQAGIITSMMPLITAVGAGVILKEVITRRVIIGAVLAVVGAVWLSLSASSSESAINPLLGNTLEFLAMVCGAGYAISARALSAKFSPLFLTSIQAFIGALFFLPFAIYEYNTIEMHITQSAFLWTLYLGVVVTLGGYGMFNFALGRIEASKASVYINLIPVFAVIVAYLFLGERLKFVQFLASGVILMGVAVSQMPTLKLRAPLKKLYIFLRK